MADPAPLLPHILSFPKQFHTVFFPLVFPLLQGVSSFSTNIPSQNFPNPLGILLDLCIFSFYLLASLSSVSFHSYIHFSTFLSCTECQSRYLHWPITLWKMYFLRSVWMFISVCIGECLMSLCHWEGTRPSMC